MRPSKTLIAQPITPTITFSKKEVSKLFNLPKSYVNHYAETEGIDFFTQKDTEELMACLVDQTYASAYLMAVASN